MTNVPSFEKWIWTELLAFDLDAPDLGVSAYLKATNFVPEGICLLISSPDIILQHEGLEIDAELPADFCSRNGHAGNEVRNRQAWTRYRLRNLIKNLQQAGSKVYLSTFTEYLEDRFHREWLSDHPECLVTWASHGRREALFVLARMADGSYLRDTFAKQLVRVCLDYGFDGWHGPDGNGPDAPIFISGCSDDMIERFVQSGQTDLPRLVTAPAGDSPEALTKRLDWIWTHRRHEWITFWGDSWAEFWKTVSDALHAIGRKTMINSAWTRDPFEALYRYGIDYRKIVDAGVDAIMVETAAGGILLGSEDRNYHYDYLAMLMHMRAYVPDGKILFLHMVKDVVENWDQLRHSPPMLEREIYALSNAWHVSRDGGPTRAANGLLVCLGDGIAPDEWTWLAERWTLAQKFAPVEVLGATIVCSDSLLFGHLKAFPETREPSSHWLTYRLLERNAPIHATVNLKDQGAVAGPLVVFNPHLLTPLESAMILDGGHEIIAIGPKSIDWGLPDLEILDQGEGRSFFCRVYNSYNSAMDLGCLNDEWPSVTPTAPVDHSMGIKEPVRFREELYFSRPSETFLQRCAELIRSLDGSFSVEGEAPGNLTAKPPLEVRVMIVKLGPGSYRISVENSAKVYARPRIKLRRPLRSASIESAFPITRLEACRDAIALVIPPMGVVVADVTTDGDL